MIEVVVYVDGFCVGNPGPGGYGVVLRSGVREKELSGGYRFTTNNRMELIAVIAALGVLKLPSRVTVYSDSKYVVDSMVRGWAVGWRVNRWRKRQDSRHYVANPDLWERVLDLCEGHQVSFEWVKGHAGNAGNERADQLSMDALRQRVLLVDDVYENMKNAEEVRLASF